MPSESDYLRERETARVSIDIPIAWGEMDALGHVNNVVFFRYLESARIEYLRRLGFGRLKEGGATGIGFILQSVQCRFRRPLIYPDTVRVTARCIEVAPDRFTLTHAVISTAQNAVAALAQGTIVCYDYAAAAKAPMPAPLRAAIHALDGDAVPTAP